MNLNYLQASYAKLDNHWQTFLRENCAEQLIRLDKELSILAQTHTIYPARECIFRALELTPLSQVRVVILGQDPYHGEGEANGLAFAVNPGVKLPPSLKNIFKELACEYNCSNNFTSELLEHWARQGVLLLNCSLTVIKDQANSMAKLGWQIVTDAIIKHISEIQPHVVFMLWGAYAQSKRNLIDSKRHMLLSTSHPSPLSVYRGFLGCNHFKLASQYTGLYNISWVSNFTIPIPPPS